MHVMRWKTNSDFNDHRASPDEPMGESIREYGSETNLESPGLSLVLVPTEELTWAMWQSGMLSMDVFRIGEGRWLEFSFTIKNQAYGVQEVGWGLLKLKPRAATE